MFQSGAFQFTAFQQGGTAPASSAGSGFEMGGKARRVAYVKPFIEQLRERLAENATSKPVESKPKAKVIEVRAAQLAQTNAPDSEYAALVSQWVKAQKFQPAQIKGADLSDLFAAQVAFRLQEIARFEQDEEEALTVLLLM